MSTEPSGRMTWATSMTTSSHLNNIEVSIIIYNRTRFPDSASLRRNISIVNNLVYPKERPAWLGFLWACLVETSTGCLVATMHLPPGLHWLVHMKTWHRPVSHFHVESGRTVKGLSFGLFASVFRKRRPLRQSWWIFLRQDKGNGSVRGMQVNQRWLTEKTSHGSSIPAEQDLLPWACVPLDCCSHNESLLWPS